MNGPRTELGSIETIMLPGHRRTTRLGFGCAYLQPETMYLIDVAYDEGIRHFDVAAAYGRGVTEGLLGAALQKRAESVTITTKFGIEPIYSNPSMSLKLRSWVRPILVRIPALRSFVSSKISSRVSRSPLNAAAAKISLERSLRALRREYIDIFLLHEAQADDECSDELLSFLQKCVERGIIGAFGVGGQRDNTTGFVSRYPGFSSVLQHEWTPSAGVEQAGSVRFFVLYRVIQFASRLRERSMKSVIDLNKWSRYVEMDLLCPGVLEKLLLRLALYTCPHSLILFSSTNKNHIKAAVDASRDPVMLVGALKLRDCLATLEAR